MSREGSSVRRWLSRVWEVSIWHPTAIDVAEFKFRSLKRVWLPIYDLVAVAGGVWAAMFGSPLLHRLFPDELLDMMGLLLAMVATICLAGVVFPQLWRVEIMGKIILVALLAAYAAAVALFRVNPDPETGFVVLVLILSLPLPLFRLTLLGEEIKERRGA